MTRIYRSAYERAGRGHGLAEIAAAENEAAGEFQDEMAGAL
jgi:hypothetical protein